MNKRDLERERDELERDGDAVKITFESNEDATNATLEFDSTSPMSAADFLEALFDWAEDFAKSLDRRN